MNFSLVEGITMENLVTKKLYVQNQEELKEFESLVQIYQDRLYRTALILTKSPRGAKELIHETYSHAKQKYHQLEPDTNLGAWLSQLLVQNFVNKYGKFRTRTHKLSLGIY